MNRQFWGESARGGAEGGVEPHRRQPVPRRHQSTLRRSLSASTLEGLVEDPARPLVVVLGGAMTAFWLNVIWMMAQQLWWEKSQGNLELYFAAPMNFMSGGSRGALAASRTNLSTLAWPM